VAAADLTIGERLKQLRPRIAAHVGAILVAVGSLRWTTRPPGQKVRRVVGPRRVRAHVAVHGNFTAGSPAGLSAEDAAKYVVGGLVVDGEWAVFVVTRAATAWVRDRFGEDTAEELKIFFRAFIESTANLNPPRWRGPDV
jgi:hypothetical protein